MKKEKKVSGLTLPNFKTYYNGKVTIRVGIDIQINKYVNEIE